MGADWIDHLTQALTRGEDAVLVTVARTEGSTPRAAGATMVVTGSRSQDTIGGGHLEWQAIHEARRLLTTDLRAPRISRFNLGARLGQCCGGVVWLLFEFIPADALALWQDNLAAFRQGIPLKREIDSRQAASAWSLGNTPGEGGTQLVADAGDWHFRQEIVEPCFPVHLFGAGHVAQALVRQLLPLGAQLTWIDSREDAFAEIDTQGINALVTDIPEAEIASALAGTYFLVMTHSHTLDFALCEEIFKRNDFAYFGLIGSRSKRASFEHRLLARGLSPARFAEFTCPIGIPGIVSKEPAAIALSVAAQLLQIHNTRLLVNRAGFSRRIGTQILPE